MTMLLAIILLLGLGFILLRQGQRARRASGLPSGRIVYSDTSQWRKLEKPLYDAALHLTGRPDYIVRHQGIFIPIEVKSGRTPPAPYDNHIYQLAAYCLLMERHYGQRPPYGLIKYPDKTYQIPYTKALEADLLSLLEEMRTCRAPHRSHHQASRCAGCGYRSICDEKLSERV